MTIKVMSYHIEFKNEEGETEIHSITAISNNGLARELEKALEKYGTWEFVALTKVGDYILSEEQLRRQEKQFEDDVMRAKQELDNFREVFELDKKECSNCGKVEVEE